MNAIHARSQLRYWPTRSEVNVDCIGPPDHWSIGVRGSRPWHVSDAKGRRGLGGTFVRARSLMRTRQPVSESLRGFFWSSPVEGHQGGRQARKANEKRAPSIGSNGNDFDPIEPTADGLFEAMCSGHHSDVSCDCEKADEIVRTRARQSSEGSREGQSAADRSARAPGSRS